MSNNVNQCIDDFSVDEFKKSYEAMNKDSEIGEVFEEIANDDEFSSPLLLELKSFNKEFIEESCEVIKKG